MRVLGVRRRRHRAAPTAGARARRTVTVELPAAPGAQHRPRPLLLPVAPGNAPWALPTEGPAARELAAFLAAVDVAPDGAVLDVGAGSGEHALLAAVYSTRLVRAVEADADRAHAARQAAATNALAVIVEGRRLAGPGGDDQGGESLDTYASRTALDPVVVRLGAGADAESLLGGATELLRRRRPWLVLGSDRTAGALLDRVSDLVALSYRVITDPDTSGSRRGYVLAPEAADAAFARRFRAWSAALLTAGSAGPDDHGDAPAVVDVSARDDEARTTT